MCVLWQLSGFMSDVLLDTAIMLQYLEKILCYEPNISRELNISPSNYLSASRIATVFYFLDTFLTADDIYDNYPEDFKDFSSGNLKLFYDLPLIANETLSIIMRVKNAFNIFNTSMLLGDYSETEKTFLDKRIEELLSLEMVALRSDDESVLSYGETLRYKLDTLSPFYKLGALIAVTGQYAVSPNDEVFHHANLITNALAAIGIIHQFGDDITDIVEDIGQKRPNIALAAIVNAGEEGSFSTTNFVPDRFKKEYPNSYELLVETAKSITSGLGFCNPQTTMLYNNLIHNVIR